MAGALFRQAVRTHLCSLPLNTTALSEAIGWLTRNHYYTNYALRGSMSVKAVYNS